MTSLSSLCILFFLTLTARQAACISCYVCDSTATPTCGESLAVEHDLFPIDCTENLLDAAFCIKETGLFEAFSLLCYQCDSSHSRYCGERLPVAVLAPTGNQPVDWYPQPLPCDHVYGTSYCVKTTGIFGGLVGTKRFCASKDFGNYCEWVRRPGDEREYRACIYTCSGDGCNGGVTPRAGVAGVLLSVVLLLRML